MSSTIRNRKEQGRNHITKFGPFRSQSVVVEGCEEHVYNMLSGVIFVLVIAFTD
jgi:hypothetical protein